MLLEATSGGLLSWRHLLQFMLAATLLLLLGGAVLLPVSRRWNGPFAARLRRRSLRLNVFVVTVLAGVLPALAMAVVLAERSASLRRSQLETQLVDTVSSAALEVDLFLDKHISGVAAAAASLAGDAGGSEGPVAHKLALYHSNYRDFLTMQVAGEGGRVIAATSMLDGRAVPFSLEERRNVADRPYFRVPMRDGRIFIGDAEPARGMRTDPVVALSAPLIDESGRRRGVVEGELSLRAFADIENRFPAIDGSMLLIVDEQQRVLFASAEAGLEALQSMARDDALRALLAPGANPDERLVYDGGAVIAHAVTRNGWRVLLTFPGAVIEKRTAADYRLAALLLVAALLFTLFLGQHLALRFGRALGTLNDSIEVFTLKGEGADRSRPANMAAELVPIYDHMKARSEQLRSTHERLKSSIAMGEELGRRLNRTIAEMEVEFEERTRDLEEANARLEDLSRRDALTGIANRRGFASFEARMRRMCRRDELPLSIVMVDIDYFKPFNDSLGHARGDECLKAVAAALADCGQRPLDLVARFGGEEFVAVLAATPLDSALIVGERMRRAVRKLDIEHPTSEYGIVTVSVGVCGALMSEDVEASELRGGADEALYAAKQSGRDCVFVSRDGRIEPFEGELETTGIRRVVELRSREAGAG